ncbi:hypothetical protein [Actinomycetospora termitidis]|uniref:Integral membrane protein n=1 Tax=Actinomycetospora termitidis TaxID=3053470 RepID=A0ABT7M2M0_9PSEU|nr:hypothetical protein [Actinomycetospora sp. Odt1-22]MDL5154913.1 hypothetical protein [Actinomycetospora sp. Odt1-22]
MDRVSWVRITGAVAVIGAVCWAVKWAAIGAQGSSGSAVDVSAFVLGLVGIVVGSCSASLRLTAGRGSAATAVACVLGAVVTFLLVPVLSTVSEAVFGAGTFLGGEAGLMVLALLAVVVGLSGFWTAPSGSASRRAAGVA